MQNLAIAFLLWSLYSTPQPPSQHPVKTVLGPKAYFDGDVVEITHVQATSPRLEQGDSVTVRGKVRLESRPNAQLSLYLTQTESKNSTETEAAQTTVVARGVSDFELKTTIKHRGVLHVTFYDRAASKPFGGVYFGTPRQMKEIADWDVSYYLENGRKP